MGFERNEPDARLVADSRGDGSRDQPITKKEDRNAIQSPWAILLCRYNDDLNDPSTTRIRDLYSQLKKANGAAWIAGVVHAAAETDDRTILDLYEAFFTITGLFTFNMVRYFDEMSHGLLDITNSRVFPCVLDLTKAQTDDRACWTRQG